MSYSDEEGWSRGYSIESQDPRSTLLNLPTTSSADPQYRYSPPKICPMRSDQKNVLPVPARTFGDIVKDINGALEAENGATQMYDLAVELLCEIRAFLVAHPARHESKEQSSSCSPVPE